MVQIRLHNTNEHIVEKSKVIEFLDGQHIFYESWDTTKLPSSLQNKFVLTDEEKQQILTTFAHEIADLARRRHYKTWDVVALSEATPHLSDLLQKFAQIHTHTEDEVRAIVGGTGIFIVRGHGTIGYFDVMLEVGDVISVPEHTAHSFTLREDRQVVAIRLFIETDGWIAHPYQEQTVETADIPE